MQQLQSLKQDKLLSNKAQNILEIFLAIVIFSIAFISLIALSNSYLNALKISRERVLANFLAQEGLELVIAKRNKDQANFDLNGSYCADYTLNFRPTSTPCLLYINNNFYNHSSGAPTIFSRLISISSTSIESATIYHVTSTVYANNQPFVELSIIITQWPF